jgi:hypothetical protein
VLRRVSVRRRSRCARVLEPGWRCSGHCVLWGPVSVFTSPWLYVAIVALCGLGRELIRSWFRHRDLALLLEKTEDPSNLRYLVRLEEARYSGPVVRLSAARSLEVVGAGRGSYRGRTRSLAVGGVAVFERCTASGLTCRVAAARKSQIESLGGTSSAGFMGVRAAGQAECVYSGELCRT